MVFFHYKDLSANQKNCVHVVLSDRAYASVISEVMMNDMLETGGVFIGNVYKSIWYLTDAIDPGQITTNHPDFFQWDTDYVNHLAERLSKIYRCPQSILGFWHRHPGSMDFFSSTDERTIRSNLNESRFGLISMLVNVDPKLRMTFYYCNDNVITRVRYDHGDEYFPKELLEYASPSQVSNNVGTPMAIATKVLNQKTFDSNNFPKTIKPQHVDEEKNEHESQSVLTSKDQTSEKRFQAYEARMTELRSLLREEKGHSLALSARNKDLEKEIEALKREVQAFRESQDEIVKIQTIKELADTEKSLDFPTESLESEAVDSNDSDEDEVLEVHLNEGVDSAQVKDKSAIPLEEENCAEKVKMDSVMSCRDDNSSDVDGDRPEIPATNGNGQLEESNSKATSSEVTTERAD